jgi:hypothetical protein
MTRVGSPSQMKKKVKVFTDNYNLLVKLKTHLFTDTRSYELPSDVKNSLPKFAQAFHMYPVYNIRKKFFKELVMFN